MTTRYKLKDTNVKVIEIVPPWVQTDLLNSKDNPNAMPLADFIAESMKLLGTDADEILVERVKPAPQQRRPQRARLLQQIPGNHRPSDALKLCALCVLCGEISFCSAPRRFAKN